MNKTFIFDYDDTLAWNQHDYSYAQLQFLTWVLDKLGHKAPDLPSLLNKSVDIDKSAVKTMGFSKERFPTSMRETYREVCNASGIEVKQEDLRIAYNIGFLAFDENRWRQQGLVPGAEETLEFLLQQGDELILLTKGDYDVQQKKLLATDCIRFFKERHIVANKDKERLLEIVGNRDKSKVWHVGNSIRSDVMPAIEAGINMIYIPCETWAWERDHNGVPESKLLTTYQKIIEIKENYLQLGD